jgi:hypothetical protein
MLLRNFRDPLVMAATGLTMAYELETEAQVVFQSQGGFGRGFRRRTFDASTHDPLLSWYAGAGVSMALRRAVTEQVGEFDEALDAGTPTQAGGDTDMLRRILKAGFRIVYDPAALNWHRHRRTASELERQLLGYEVAAFAIFCRATLFEGDLGAMSRAAWELRGSVRTLIRAVKQQAGRPALNRILARIYAALSGPGLYLYARWRRS